MLNRFLRSVLISALGMSLVLGVSFLLRYQAASAVPPGQTNRDSFRSDALGIRFDYETEGLLANQRTAEDASWPPAVYVYEQGAEAPLLSIELTDTICQNSAQIIEAYVGTPLPSEAQVQPLKISAREGLLLTAVPLGQPWGVWAFCEESRSYQVLLFNDPSFHDALRAAHTLSPRQEAILSTLTVLDHADVLAQ